MGQVFGEIDESQVMKNVAMDGTATASSNAYGGIASRAVDGSTNGHWGGASVTHTHYESNPWWKVSMPSAYNVQTVMIWNRVDCCWNRLTNPVVELLNGGTVVKQIQIQGEVPREGGATLDFGGAYGDEVRVRLETGTSRQFLSLAEVQVFAKTSAPGATELPSSSPTGSPVAAASESPSSSPTGSPVADASSSPSSSPTGSPVAAASESPSSSPSDGPTASPSDAPVIQVVTQPAPTTDAPTPSPSSSPSEAVGSVVAGPNLTELTTTYEGGNGQAGIMFDIEAVNSLVIEEIDIN